MKELLRTLGINALALYFTALLLPGLSIQSNLQTYLILTVLYSVLFALLTLVLGLIIAPMNVLTLGYFSATLTLLSIFIISRFSLGLSINEFNFPGISLGGYAIKPFHASVILSYVIISVIMFTIARLMKWVCGE